MNRVAVRLELCSRKTVKIKVLWVDEREWCSINSWNANSCYAVKDRNKNEAIAIELRSHVSKISQKSNL